LMNNDSAVSSLMVQSICFQVVKLVQVVLTQHFQCWERSKTGQWKVSHGTKWCEPHVSVGGMNMWTFAPLSVSLHLLGVQKYDTSRFTGSWVSLLTLPFWGVIPRHISHIFSQGLMTF
jgi:hypothetical protein